MSKRQSTRAAARQPSGESSLAAGFKTVLICILLAGIIGSAVKLYFSPVRIETFIRSQIEKQNLPYKIEFKSARLTLARGIIPTFAIDVLGVSAAHSAPCATEPFAEASVLVLPIDWLKLLTGKVQLGFVVADGVSASIDRAMCARPASQAERHDEVLKDEDFAQDEQLIEAEKKPWFKVEDLERVKKAIAGFEIQNGMIYFDGSKKFVQLSYFDVWHKGNEVKLEGEVTLPSELTYQEKFPPLQFRGSVTPEVAKLDARSSFDEGELAASIELTPTENQASPQAKVLFQAGAMPLSIFSDFLRKLGVLSNSKLQPKFLWLNCDVSSEGSLLKLLKHTPLKVDNCVVEGDAGRIDIGPAVRNAEGIWQPFKVEIKEFNIEDLLKTFGEKGPSGVLSSFGVLKGTLDYLEKDRLNFGGRVEGLEVYFSNRNVRAYQKIESVDLQAQLRANEVTGQIFKPILAPGKMTGEVTFAFDKRFEAGTVKVNATELSLDPRIETLMADGLFEGLGLNGTLEVREHKLFSWAGKIEAASYAGTQLKIVKPSVETKFANDRFDLTAQSSSGELAPNSKWLGWIKRGAGDIAISSATGEQWIPISNIRTQVSIEPQLIGWKNATFTANQSKVQVTSTGEIVDNKTVAGLITTIEPGNKNRKFVISGSPKSPTLTPRE